VECFREGDGWVGGNSGNNNLVCMPTSAGRGTVVWWSEAPAGATAGRVRLGDQEQTVGVGDGFVFVVFDNVPEEKFGSTPRCSLPDCRKCSNRRRVDAKSVDRSLAWASLPE
jgi:hypothetical protein